MKVIILLAFTERTYISLLQSFTPYRLNRSVALRTLFGKRIGCDKLVAGPAAVSGGGVSSGVGVVDG